MIHRIVIAATASLGAAAVIWVYAQLKWERQMLRDLKHGGRL